MPLCFFTCILEHSIAKLRRIQYLRKPEQCLVALLLPHWTSVAWCHYAAAQRSCFHCSAEGVSLGCHLRVAVLVLLASLAGPPWGEHVTL